MATTSSAIAHTFSEALIAKMLGQLHQAVPKLTGAKSSEPEVIKQALPPGTMTEVKDFLLSLAQENSLDRLPEIVQALEASLLTAEAKLQAEVVSAVPLSPAQQKSTTTKLQAQYGQLSVHFKVDESLIGGLVIRIGDQVIDNSIRLRLGSIKHTLLTQ
jgi:F-type H+-transporting ATPase subunit delta